MATKQTIAVDFDKTIHSYENGWGDGSIYGTEIKGAFTALLTFMERGYNVVIFTARPADQVNAWMMEKWPFKMFPVPKAQNTKPAAIAYIDDRAVTFKGDWAEIIPLFPYNK